MPTIESAEGSVCLAFPWLLCGQPLLTPSPGGHPEVPRPEADPQMGPAGGDAGAALRGGGRRSWEPSQPFPRPSLLSPWWAEFSLWPGLWQARPLTRHGLSCPPQTWNCWWCHISSPRAPLSQAALLPLVVKKCWGYTNASSIGQIMLGVLLKIDFTYVLGDLRGFVT